MNARLRMYKYCYSNEGAIYAKGLFNESAAPTQHDLLFELTIMVNSQVPLNLRL